MDILPSMEPRVTLAGHRLQIECLVRGAKPSVQVSWYREGEELLRRSLLDTNGSLQATAKLQFIPEAVDDGASISCVASNPLFPEHRLQKSLSLIVQCK